MSNTASTKFLRFPSGRSSHRLREDAKKNAMSLDDMAIKSGIDMPWASALDYLKDKDHLALSGNIKDVYASGELVPKQGRVNFLIGTPDSYINQSTLQALMLTAKVHSEKNIAYCDFSVERRNGVPVAVNLLKSAPYVEGPRCQQYLDELARLSVPWEKSFEFVRSNAKSFVSARVPTQFRFKGDRPAAIIAMNPRKFVLTKLASRLGDSTILIADSQADSVLRLGDVKHWQQLKNERCAMDRRALLGHTDVIAEQRCLKIGGEKYLLRRSVELTDVERHSLLDKQVGMKAVLMEISERLLPWQDVVVELSGKAELTSAQSDAAQRQAACFDSAQGSERGVSASMVPMQ